MFKDFMKKFTYITGDVPTSEELELVKESRERTHLVIWARWFLLGILAAYGIIPYFFFQHASADIGQITAAHCVIPVVVWSFVALYNAWLHYSHKEFAKIRALNPAQLLLDLLFVTVVVHFSGGAVSWFWTMYMVVTLEAALIMEKDSDTYAIAMGGMLAYGGILLFEFHGLISPVRMPFENIALQQSFSYNMIKWGWVSITNMCVAVTGVFMMGTIRRREDRLRDLVTKDNLTRLYNRRYFLYRLHSEIQRSKRYHRTLSLVILDVDDFKKVNDRYGHLAGDELLRILSETILGNIRRSDGKPSYEVDIACRYGGEEIAVILPETPAAQGAVAAERLRAKIEGSCRDIVMERIHGEEKIPGEDGMRVTVSIGVASYPQHAVDLEGLIRKADEAMYVAKRSGKNRVVVADDVYQPFPALSTT
jgi:diguanylate cyclase (GGDEF)-like protein